RKRFELYKIISNTNGVGFFIAYLLLNTTNASNNEQTELYTKALVGFFHSLFNKRLWPQYFFTNKNFTEINAAKEAINEKLKSHNKIKHTQYQPDNVIAEFDFIDPSFKSDLSHFESDYYINSGLTQIDEDDCLLDSDMHQICKQKVAA
ncbi:16133_t:CDS:2, partial [Cetraspora pellucida]